MCIRDSHSVGPCEAKRGLPGYRRRVLSIDESNRTSTQRASTAHALPDAMACAPRADTVDSCRGRFIVPQLVAVSGCQRGYHHTADKRSGVTWGGGEGRRRRVSTHETQRDLKTTLRRVSLLLGLLSWPCLSPLELEV